MNRETFLSLVFALSIAASAVGDEIPSTETAAEKRLSPIEARQAIGKEIVVRMEVRAAKDRLEKRGEIYLDSETSFRDDKNFAIVITRRGAESFAAKEIRDPAEHFRDKLVEARGKVKEVDGVPRIEIDDAAKLRLVNPSDNANAISNP